MVYEYVASKIAFLNSIKETGVGRGALANLRRGVGTVPGAIPELWGIMFDRFPEELMGKAEPSYAEWAVHSALTLYALHVQGGSGNAYKTGVSLGAAVSKLIKSDEDADRILKRLNLVVTSNDQNDMAYHLRSVIQLLKNNEIPLDHAGLAKDLYLYSFPEYATAVKLRWGRDFYSKKYKNEDNKGEKE